MADSNLIWAATIPPDGAAISVAPLGTPIPTTATETLNAAFVDLGWVNEDGVTITENRDITRHKAWSGVTVKTTQDNYECTAKFSLLENSLEVVQVVFGVDNVVDDGGGAFTINYSDRLLDRQTFVIDFSDGSKIGRHIIQEGLIVNLEDLKFVHTDLLMYGLEVDVYKPQNGESGIISKYDNIAGS